jgi:hypothetical protein
MAGGPPIPSTPLGHVIRGDRRRRSTSSSSSPSVVIECWLDFACPFSGRFYRGFQSALNAYEASRRDAVDAMCVVVHNQVQPWHAQSALAHETSLACERYGPPWAFRMFCDAAFDEKVWDFFTDVWCEDKTKGEMYDAYCALAWNHVGGPDWSEAEKKATRDALRLDAAALARGEKNPGNAMTQELKFYVKLGRQTGVHVSPSVLVNGLAVDTSSGWTREEWFAFFDRVLGESS